MWSWVQSRRSRRGLACTGLLLILVAGPGAVRGQPVCPPVPAQADEARRLASSWWRFGTSYFDGKSYGKALHAWQCANKLSPDPRAHYNIGRAAARARRYALAIRSYRSFLKLRPTSPKRAEVEERIQALQSARRLASARRRVALPRDAAQPEPIQRAAKARKRRGLVIAGWVTLSVGLALAVGSGVFGGLAAVERQAVEEAAPGTPWQPTVAAHDRRFRNYRLTAWLCAGVGVGALATGAVLLILGRRRRPERATVAPVVLTGGGGLQLTLGF